MGVDLSALALDHAQCAVNIGTEEIKVTYRPSILTTGMLERLKAAEEANDFTVLTDVMAEFLVEWDITNGGEPLATDDVTLKLVPLSIVQAVFYGVMEDASRGEAESSSNAG